MNRVPKLRFPEFSGEWEEKKILDISENILAGATPSTSVAEYWENGNIPWMSSGEINKKRIKDVEKRITEKGFSSSSTKMIPKNSVLIALAGQGKTRGTVAINKIELCTNQSLASIVPKKNQVNYEFLYYNFDNRYEEFREISSGEGTRGGLNLSLIKELILIFPSLPEQQEIASFLSSVDSKIEKLERKKELWEQYKKGMMQKIFSQELRFKDENGEDYPEWKDKELGNIGETFNGLTGKTKEEFGNGKSYITYKSIFDSSRIDINRFEYVNILENEKQNKVQYGDIFFTTSSETPNEVGMASVLLDEVEECYLNSFCFGFRLNDILIVSPEFMRFYLRSEVIRGDISKLAQGSTRYNLSKIELMKLVLTIPTLPEQTKIANFLSSIDSKIEIINKELDGMKEFKKGLLQQMFI